MKIYCVKKKKIEGKQSKHQTKNCSRCVKAKKGQTGREKKTSMELGKKTDNLAENL